MCARKRGINFITFFAITSGAEIYNELLVNSISVLTEFLKGFFLALEINTKCTFSIKSSIINNNSDGPNSGLNSQS